VDPGRTAHEVDRLLVRRGTGRYQNAFDRHAIWAGAACIEEPARQCEGSIKCGLRARSGPFGLNIDLEGRHLDPTCLPEPRALVAGRHELVAARRFEVKPSAPPCKGA
jgi:hypothetical protein